MNKILHGDVFSVAGLSFRAEFEPDYDHAAPWKDEDGHGPVGDWQSTAEWWSDGRRVYRPKRAGERVLYHDGRHARFYDYAEAIRIGKRDGWGLAPAALAALREKLGREPSRGEVVEASVDADFERLRAWCAGEWGYVSVVVTLLDVNGNATDEDDVFGGVESDDEEYLAEVATNLATNLAERVGNAPTIPARRPSHYTVRVT